MFSRKFSLRAAAISVGIALATVAGAASAEVFNIRDIRFTGLVAFSDGPDPSGQSPVYYVRMDTRSLHHVVNPTVAANKFGQNWVDGILFCGRASADQRTCNDFRTYTISTPIRMQTDLSGVFGVR